MAAFQGDPKNINWEFAAGSDAAKLVNMQFGLAQFKEYCATALTAANRLSTGSRSRSRQLTYTPDCPASDDHMHALLQRGYIPSQVRDWAAGTQTYKEMLKAAFLEEADGGDFMFHTNKGVIGIKIDGALMVDAVGLKVSNIKNQGKRRCIGCLPENEADDDYIGGLASPVTLSTVYDCALSKWETSGIESVYGDKATFYNAEEPPVPKFSEWRFSSSEVGNAMLLQQTAAISIAKPGTISTIPRECFTRERWSSAKKARCCKMGLASACR